MSTHEKTYNKFIVMLEIVYAILMAWGYGRAAEFFTFSSPHQWAGLVLISLVLIRFIFAPSHNVGGLMRSHKMTIMRARAIIFFDIPVLILHSFIFYRMCYNLSLKNYSIFYFDCMLLLAANATWLITIRKRLQLDGAFVPPKFGLWIGNNFAAAAAIIVILGVYRHTGGGPFGVYFWLCSAVVFANSVIDLGSCAQEYFDEM